MASEKDIIAITDYQIIDQVQNRIIYQVLLKDQTDMWVKEEELVGCHHFIDRFFKKRERSKSGSGSSGKVSHEKKEKVEPIWRTKTQGTNQIRNVEESVKNKASNLKRLKKYEIDEVTQIQNKIQELRRYVKFNQDRSKRLDYLLDSVEGVFMKDGKPYCCVKTVPPVRSYVVSVENMEKYFTNTMIEHYKIVKKMQKKKRDKQMGEEKLEPEEEESGEESEREGSKMEGEYMIPENVNDFEGQGVKRDGNMQEQQGTIKREFFYSPDRPMKHESF